MFFFIFWRIENYFMNIISSIMINMKLIYIVKFVMSYYTHNLSYF